MRRPTTTLARALAGRGQLDEAIAHYQKALEIKPDFDAHNNLGPGLAGRGEVDEAIAITRGPWKSNPTMPRPTMILARRWPAGDSSTRPSPITRRPWKSSPTMPTPTTTLATPWPAADSSTRRSPITRRPWKSTQFAGPQQPRQRPGQPRTVRRGRRPLPEGAGNQTRPCAGPQ